MHYILMNMLFAVSKSNNLIGTRLSTHQSGLDIQRMQLTNQIVCTTWTKVRTIDYSAMNPLSTNAPATSKSQPKQQKLIFILSCSFISSGYLISLYNRLFLFWIKSKFYKRNRKRLLFAKATLNGC